MKLLHLSVLFFFIIPFAKSQCINSFPYHEDFETGSGSWLAGGNKNDWAWGVPNKPTINKAASGIKCWVVGGLNSSNYADGESSWVESPCFDFTNVKHPYIQFSYFWESENQYDGGNLQYSTDGGSLWKNVGKYNDVVNCLDSNWYNFGTIKYLSGLAYPQSGWSGNVQSGNGGCSTGGGSGKWVTCRHCMSALAGLPSVVFRFTFGAGTSCNNFDGNAFDNIYIEEAPPIKPEFSSACTGNNTFSFTDLSTLCPETWSWNFGDGSSGNNNVSTVQNPQHTFNAPGTYTITLTAGSDCSGMFSVTHTVSVIGLTTSAIPESCSGSNNGVAIVKATGVTGSNYSYNWNTTPAQSTDSAKNLAPGAYTVTVTAPNACAASGSTIVKSAIQLKIKATVKQPVCYNETGTVVLTPSGGTTPYMYSWTPNISTNTTAKNAVAGTYYVTIADKNNCTLKDTFTINAPEPEINILLNGIPDTCNLPNGSASSFVSGGTPPYKYLWTPGNMNTDSVKYLTGNISYQLLITDSNKCTASSTISIGNIGGFTIYLGKDSMICNENAITLYAGEGYVSYKWQDSSTQSMFTATTPGKYWVTVSNDACTNSDTITITPCSTTIYVPNGFSPNGDGTNDLFKAISHQDINRYILRIFNRWGQLIFETTNINIGWDGTFKGQPCSMGAYTYYIQYDAGSGSKLIKGSVTLLR